MRALEPTSGPEGFCPDLPRRAETLLPLLSGPPKSRCCESPLDRRIRNLRKAHGPVRPDGKSLIKPTQKEQSALAPRFELHFLPKLALACVSIRLESRVLASDIKTKATVPKSIPALIEPPLLVWARQRAGFSCEIAAAKIDIPLDRLVQWEEGTDRPSMAQLR